MRAKVLFLFVVLFGVSTVWADRIDVSKARRVAAHVVNRLHVSGQKRVAPVERELELVYTARSKGLSVSSVGGRHDVPYSVVDYFVFNVGQDAGFVIVAGDDRVRPVLGYSDSGAFYADSLPENMANWLAGYQKEINWAEQAGIRASAKAEAEWLACLESTSVALLSGNGVLLNTAQWGQDEPFNGMTPLISGQHAVTGCVATAQAIIMRYHGYPVQAVGGVTSYDGYAVSYGQYDWGDMPADYSGGYTQQQADAVAELMWHCGANVGMSYGAGASGASDKLAALSFRDIFGYAASCYMKKSYYSWEEWKAMIRSDLDAGCPIMYSGQSNTGGHSFVCDGYTADDTYHFNWGWNGYMNGYFILSTLDAMGDGDGYCQDQSMTVHIRPDASGEKYVYRPIVTNIEYSGSYPVPQNTQVKIRCSFEYCAFENLDCYIGLGVVDAQGNLIQQPVADRQFSLPAYVEGWRTLTTNLYITLEQTLTNGQRIAPLISLNGQSWEILRCEVGKPVGVGAQGLVDGIEDDPDDPQQPVNVDLVHDAFAQRFLEVITDGSTASYTNTGTYVWSFNGLNGDAWLRFVPKDASSWKEHLKVFWGESSESIGAEGSGTQVELTDGSWWIPVAASDLSGSNYWVNLKVLSDRAGLLDYDVEIYAGDKQTFLSEIDGLHLRFVNSVHYVTEPTKITGSVHEKIPFTVTLSQVDETCVGQAGTLHLFFQNNSSKETHVYYVNDNGQEIEATYSDGAYSDGSGDYMTAEVPVEALRNDVPYQFKLQSEKVSGNRYQGVILSQIEVGQDVYLPVGDGSFRQIVIEEEVVIEPMLMEFVPATATGFAGEDILFTVKATKVDPAWSGMVPRISLNIEGSTYQEVEVDYIDEQNQRIPLNIIPHPKWSTSNLCVTESYAFPALTEGREYRFAFRYIGGFSYSMPEYGSIRIESIYGDGYEELPFEINERMEYTVNPKTTATITVSGEVVYGDDHYDQHVVVASDGIYVVRSAGARIQNLTVEDGGQIVLENNLTVAGTISVNRNVPDNCWTTFSAPCTLALENGDALFGSKVLEARSGFVSAQTQLWTSFAETNVPEGTALLLATSQEQPQEISWTAGSRVLPKAVTAEAVGNVADGDYFKLQGNSLWENLRISGKAYVLNTYTNSFELEDQPVIPPFQAYMTASDKLMNQISSLRLGDSATSVETLPDWGFRAWVDNGILSFETAQEKDVLVYTLNGVLVGTYPNSKGIRRTDLKPGAYLVVCGDKAIKIVM